MRFLDAPGGNANPAGEMPAEKSGPSDLDHLVTRIVLDKVWVQTRQIWDGVRMRWERNRWILPFLHDARDSCGVTIPVLFGTRPL